jgi:hypothetical protein
MFACGIGHDLEGRVSEHGDVEQNVPRTRAKALEPGGGQLSQRGRHRKRLARPELPPVEGPDELEREERIPRRRLARGPMWDG